MPRAKVVSFINYKGGVGKTTTTYHVGCSLAQHFAKKCFLIDIDPQTNLTFLCAPYEKWVEFRRKSGTIASLYERYQAKKALETKRVIWKAPVALGRQRIQDLDLIPCDIDLLGEDLGGGQIVGSFPTLELLKQNAKAYLRERFFLRAALREVEDQYDYVLIDCPPNLYLMTQNALVASAAYVITAIPDHLSTIGLNILQQKVSRIGALIDSALTFAGGDIKSSLKLATLGGVIFVRVRIGGSMITNTHLRTMAGVRSQLGALCFSTHTTELIGYGEAAESALPVWMQTGPNAVRAADKKEYVKITEEFLQRL